jgi:hypothetical protein
MRERKKITASTLEAVSSYFASSQGDCKVEVRP